ncbi:baseplate J/gp47 family protein [uncultured Methanobrevibacter sp.]|uniref:baseplate J/gp47 family protein n=1 Tax=uncultured Methanobrevibacter sp. TaxID=253161 RepID=UPI0025EAC67E|nr:baseplate J/gp47 family protein [uncultured Methanobrevibacter sp.]
MNYVEKTYEEIFEAALQDSLEQGLISHADDFEDFIANRQDISNYYVMDKSVISMIIRRVYEDITLVYQSNIIESAEGIDLDNIGDKVGVLRPQATKSSVEVTFYLPEISDEDITISEGFIVANENNDVQFETVDEIYFAAGSTTAKVNCLSLDVGPDTKVNAGSVVNIVSANDYNLTCSNDYKSAGGIPAYDDKEYRYLLMNWIKIRLKGSDEAYLNYFANKDGVDDYRIIPNWDGSGTVKIIVEPGDSTLLNEIYNELQSSVCQEDTIINLFAPTEHRISIYAKVNVDIDLINPYSELEKSDIQSRIVSAIKVFIDGGYINTNEGRVWYSGLGLGEDFIPHKLAVFLDEEIPELKNITFTKPLDYIPILDEEKGVSDNITVEMI